MKTLSLMIALIVAAVATVHLLGAGSADLAADPRTLFIDGADAFDSAVARLGRTIDAAPDAELSGETTRRDLLAARVAYKRIELFAEYFAPGTADAINGPALEEVEEGDPNQTIIPPSGLQVIEEMLFAGDPIDRDAVARNVDFLGMAIRSLRRYAEATTLSDANVLDAIRLELARITTLGMAGFDAPVTLTSMPESAAALEGIASVARWYSSRAPRTYGRLERQLAAAAAELRRAPFESHDRLAFLEHHAEPIALTLAALRAELGVGAAAGRRLFRSDAPSPFAERAFDAVAAAPIGTRSPTNEQIELGRTLFFDPILSGNGERSCASCHRPDRAFADGEPRSIAFDFVARVARNSPTLINAALQRGAFYDLRVTFLEDQVSDVVGNPAEMHGSLATASRRLSESSEYRAAFERAFGDITEATIRRALAAFIRSLERLDAPFDRAVRGDAGAMAADARRGFTVFMGKARCGTCHFAPLFNGTVPPAYEKSEVEILGVTERFDTLRPVLDRDRGRGPVVRIGIHDFAFRTPTLRNVALTAPYMHNGAFATLEEVIEFYDRGGGEGLGIQMQRQTLPPDRLNLSAGEKQDLIAFMHSLTDTTALPRAPARLPRAGGAFADRVVGGRY